MLSAHSRRSPATTAESSPTLERQFDGLEIQHPDDTIKSIPNVDESTDRVEAGAEENFVETESQESTRFFSSCCVIKRNLTPTDNIESKLTREAWQEGETTAYDLTRTVDDEEKLQNVEADTNEESSKEGSNSDCRSKRVNAEEEMSELTPKQGILRDARAHSQIITPEESTESDKEQIEKSPEVEQHNNVPRSQILFRVLRGDSRDSGIGDCQITSPLQVDESGIVSTIKEETDYESYSRENKRTPRREDAVKNRRSSTSGILTTLARSEESPFSDTESSRSDDKVATKSGVTKASCAINLERKGVCDCDKLSFTIIDRPRACVTRAAQ